MHEGRDATLASEGEGHLLYLHRLLFESRMLGWTLLVFPPECASHWHLQEETTTRAGVGRKHFVQVTLASRTVIYLLSTLSPLQARSTLGQTLGLTILCNFCYPRINVFG